MKPLHIGLLMVGAAIAGGIAVKMTAPPSFPAAPAKPIVVTPAARTPVTPAPVAQTSAPRPAVTTAAARTPVVRSAPATVADNSTSAPPPVYSEPPHTRPAPFPASAKKETEIAEVGPPPGVYQRPTAASQPAVQQAEEPQPEAPRRVTLEPGTFLAARMLETLSSDRVAPGDTFSATLAEPLVIDGLIIAERGSRVDGRVVNAQRPGRINGRSEIQLALSNITTADGQRIAIATEPWVKTAGSTGMRQAEQIGGGAALGAIIGAIAGGGTGAAIGAGIGSGAGIGTAIATRPKAVTVPTETVIRFKVTSRVTITERQL